MVFCCLLNSYLVLAQHSFNSIQVTSQCPKDGIAVTRIDGKFTADSNTKTYPVFNPDCKPSFEKTAYAEHTIIIKGDKNRIALRLIGENVRLDLYNRNYYPGEPCSNLLVSVFPTDWITLENLAEFPILMLVVSSTVPVTDSIKYTIEFEEEVGLIQDKCLFSCEQKKDVLNLTFPEELLMIQSSVPYQLKEKSFLVNFGCRIIGIREHNFTTADTSFTIISNFFSKPEEFEKSFDLPPLELTCSTAKLTLPSIIANLSLQYSNEEIKEFLALVDFINQDHCNPSAFSTIYGFFGLDNLNRNETDTFELRYEVVNHCAQKSVQGSQKFFIRRTESSENASDLNVAFVADPLNCRKKYIFPIPPGYKGCFGEDLHYTIAGDASIFQIGNSYEANLSPGTYSFVYTIQECCSHEPVFFNLKVTILEPPLLISDVPSVTLLNSTMTLSNSLYTSGIIDPCYQILSRVVASSSSCGTISGNEISFCCDDLVFNNDTTIASGKVTLNLDVIRDKSDDGMFGNNNDDTVSIDLDVEVLDHIIGIVCPKDAILPCNTIDIRPEVTGFANVHATCFSTYKPRYRDIVFNPSPDHILITRTFYFQGNLSVQECQQKIEIDCTVKSKEVDLEKSMVTINPNPFYSRPVLSFFSHKSEYISFSVLDNNGKLLSTVELPILEGKNNIELPAEIFKTSGLYYVDFLLNGKHQKARLIKMQ